MLSAFIAGCASTPDDDSVDGYEVLVVPVRLAAFRAPAALSQAGAQTELVDVLVKVKWSSWQASMRA